MVEAGAKEVNDEEILAGLEFAHKIIKDICNAQLDYISNYKKQFGIPEVQPSFNNPDISLYEVAKDFLTEEKLECLYDK
jgi:polyribonucleotide nucleotidyltransferase